MKTLNFIIRNYKQTRGGIVNPKSLETQNIIFFENVKDFKDINVSSTLISNAFNNLLRFMITKSKDLSFYNLEGFLNSKNDIFELNIKDFDIISIKNAYILSNFDIYKTQDLETIDSYNFNDYIIPNLSSIELMQYLLKQTDTFLISLKDTFNIFDFEFFTYKNILCNEKIFYSANSIYFFNFLKSNIRSVEILKALIIYRLGIKKNIEIFNNFKYIQFVNLQNNTIVKIDISKTDFSVFFEIDNNILEKN